MQMVLKLEEHEKSAICTVLDMFRQMDEEDITHIIDDNVAMIGIGCDDAIAFLESIYNTYA